MAKLNSITASVILPRMQVREREVGINREISPPPIFNLRLCQEAKRVVKRFGLKGQPALEVASTLYVYNLLNGGNTSDGRNPLEPFAPIPGLILEERVASNPSNPLPTIGFEVESPKKAGLFYTNKNYGRFFDLIWLPRNKLNPRTHDEQFDRWEFSPPPSYSASVQARILCELIKGGFIPSLAHSQSPEDIVRLLDDKLVSLHVNLGVPSKITTSLSTDNDNVRTFLAAFALGFTSTQRLDNKTSGNMGSFKEVDTATAKSGKRQERLEIKALEVRTQSTYRLMHEIQNLGAALFAYLGDKDSHLGSHWLDAREEFKLLYKSVDFHLGNLGQKIELSHLVASTDISQRLRTSITRRSHQVARAIDSGTN